MFQLPCNGLAYPSPVPRAGSGKQGSLPCRLYHGRGQCRHREQCSLLPHQPRGEGGVEGVRVGWCWGGSRRDLTPAADNLDGLVIGKDRPRFKG